MIAIRTRILAAGMMVAGAFSLGQMGLAQSAEPTIRVLIVDGQNNHNWRAMTPPIKADLEHSGRFSVDVATTPGAGHPHRRGSRFIPISPNMMSFSAITTANHGRKTCARRSRNTSPRGAAW